MENTNEREEMVTLDSVGNCSFEQSEGTCGTCQAGEGNTGNEQQQRESGESQGVSIDTFQTDHADDDETIKVLKRFPKVCARIAELMQLRAETLALELIEKGLSYDVAVADADNNGYLRGKNEKIELAKAHRMPQLDAMNESHYEDVNSKDIFPRYVKKNFWDE